MKKWMYISDVHVPYEDKDAVAEMFEAIKKEKPRYLILGGDIVDFYKISRFDKDPLNTTTLQEEIAAAKVFLAKCRKYAGSKCNIVYIEGNHEERLTKFIVANAPEFAHFSEFTIAGLLHLDDFNIQYVAAAQQYWIEDFLFRHGHEMFGMSGIPGSNARKGIATYHSNYIQGHVHKANIVNVGNLRCNFIGVESPCLCEMNPAYMKGTSQWQQGWTIGEVKNYRWQVRQTIL